MGSMMYSEMHYSFPSTTTIVVSESCTLGEDDQLQVSSMFMSLSEYATEGCYCTI